eukprot:3935497-Rhodomonas_salina.1
MLPRGQGITAGNVQDAVPASDNGDEPASECQDANAAAFESDGQGVFGFRLGEASGHERMAVLLNSTPNTTAIKVHGMSVVCHAPGSLLFKFELDHDPS